MHKDFHLTQLAHHAGHQGLILAGGFDLRVFPMARIEPLCALACFDKVVQDLHAFRGVLQDICDGNLCE